MSYRIGSILLNLDDIIEILRLVRDSKNKPSCGTYLSSVKYIITKYGKHSPLRDILETCMEIWRDCNNEEAEDTFIYG